MEKHRPSSHHARARARALAMAALTALPALLAGPSAAQGVRLPAPDKDGWIRLFRGDNTGDFFAANNGAPPNQGRLAFPNDTYKAVGDTIQVTGSPGGQIYFKQSFSHYRVRYKYRFPGKTGNCGMLLHVQPDDPTWAGFPRSVESQGDPNQGMGQLWAISDVWVTVKARSIDGRLTYDPSAKDTVYGAKDGNSRVVAGRDGWARPGYESLSARTGWVTQEAVVRGRDTITHIVMDTVRIQYRLPRVSSGGTPNKVTKYLESGLIAWQSEGTPVWYTDLEVMLLPGDPLYVPVYAAFHARNTLAPKPARKVLRLKDGVLALAEADGGRDRLVDLAGRALAPALAGLPAGLPE